MTETNRHGTTTRYSGRGRVRARVNQVKRRIAGWLAAHSLPFLRGGLGVVYLWFGALKFVPGMSPAQGLAVQTIDVLTMGMIPAEVSLVLLAALECAIGIGFLTGKYMRTTLVLMAFQIAGALTPLVLFPETVFTSGVYALTLEGQYIVKNVVSIGAGLVLGATVRGGRIVSQPEGDLR